MPTRPSDGRVTSPYGPRKAEPELGIGSFHYGEDSIGSGVSSPVAGSVVFAAFHPIFGNTVGVREAANSSVIWWMSHLASIAVSVGQEVAQGASLGPIGQTGRAYGVHVHTERREGGVASIQTGRSTNPANFYTATAGGGSTPITERRVPDMAVRLLHMTHLSKPGANVYYRGFTGTGKVENSQYSQDQANRAAQLIGQPTITVTSEADLIAWQAVLKSLPGDPTTPVVDVDEQAIAEVVSKQVAAAIEAGLAPKFAAIPDAVVDEQAARLAE